MLHYNYNAAIELRGKTFEQAGYTDGANRENWADVIDFRTSLSMVGTEIGADYAWANITECEYVLMNSGNNGTNYSTWVTKAEWKRLYSAYRKYCRVVNAERADFYF